MSRAGRDPTGVGLWVAAVVGAMIIVLGPLTPWVLGVEIVGLALCLTASATLVVWFARR